MTSLVKYLEHEKRIANGITLFLFTVIAPWYCGRRLFASNVHIVQRLGYGLNFCIFSYALLFGTWGFLFFIACFQFFYGVCVNPEKTPKEWLQ